MKTVTVSKQELLTKVIENRDEHLKDYKEMMIEYKQKLIEALELMIEENRVIDKNFDRTISLQEPVNNVADYDRIISMLKMSVADTIELDFHEYEQYVMNNWHWSGSFEISKTRYMSS
ncbi:MAG: hypothetical protein J7L15_06010 [Clostridiales bacterium]|nr:hypothetical protein [Clostridiales bacterium]